MFDNIKSKSNNGMTEWACVDGNFVTYYGYFCTGEFAHVYSCYLGVY
jgi:hypothetical protein